MIAVMLVKRKQKLTRGNQRKHSVKQIFSSLYIDHSKDNNYWPASVALTVDDILLSLNKW